MNARLDEEWSSFAAYFEERGDWVTQGLLPVVRLAHNDAILRGLSPFQSLSRLCFGRTNGGAPEAEWPCIEVDREGRFFVFDRTYPSGAEAVLLVETASPDEALRTLKQHLPASAR